MLISPVCILDFSTVCCIICIFQLTQSSLWLDNAVELLRSDCHQEIEKNSTLKNSSDVSIDNLCPGFPDICSGHGTCKEGNFLMMSDKNNIS